jgi:hypothetical protein
MRDLLKPVAVADAYRESVSGKNATTDEAGNLHASLPSAEVPELCLQRIFELRMGWSMGLLVRFMI